MRALIYIGLAAVISTSSCTVDTGGDDGAASATETSADGDGDPDSGDGDGEPGDGDGDPGTGDGDGDPATGDGDGDPGTGDGDGDDPGDCVEADPSVALGYTLDGLDGAPLDLSWTCTTTAVSTLDGLELGLDCPDAEGPITLDLSLDPGLTIGLEPGEMVELRYVYDGPWWLNLYLRLDDAGGGHLLTLIDGDSLTPPGPASFELPVPITAQPGLCAPVLDFCGDHERYALRFELDGETSEVFDGHHVILGPPPGLDVWVDRAGRLHDISCTDTPDEWYRLLIVSAGDE